MGIDKQLFRQLSVRSRVAYCARCIEIALLKQGVRSSLLDEVLNSLWEFTEYPMLDKWHSQIKEIIPYNVLDPAPNALTDFETISLEKATRLKELYASLPNFIIEMIDNAFWPGLNNLYSGVVAYSEITLEPIMSVVQIMEDNKIELPDITPFLASDLAEEGGWGIEHDRSFYVPGT